MYEKKKSVQHCVIKDQHFFNVLGLLSSHIFVPFERNIRRRSLFTLQLPCLIYYIRR